MTAFLASKQYCEEEARRLLCLVSAGVVALMLEMEPRASHILNH